MVLPTKKISRNKLDRYDECKFREFRCSRASSRNRDVEVDVIGHDPLSQ